MIVIYLQISFVREIHIQYNIKVGEDHFNINTKILVDNRTAVNPAHQPQTPLSTELCKTVGLIVFEIWAS
jgi:hypothetical protein